MPDAQAELVPAAYLAHLAALGPSVPDAARRLANEVNLHDGLLRVVEPTNGRLELLFRAGDQQIGYFDAWLRYDGVGIAEADAQFLQSANGRSDIELLYDEFDRHDRDWIHQLLFWLPGRQYHEVSVRFVVIELQVLPATARFDDGTA